MAESSGGRTKDKRGAAVATTEKRIREAVSAQAPGDAGRAEAPPSPRKAARGTIGNDLAEHWKKEGRTVICKRDEGGQVRDAISEKSCESMPDAKAEVARREMHWAEDDRSSK